MTLANMGANMSAMLSGNSPLTESQSDNAEGAEIGAVEMLQSSAPANSPVSDSTQDAPVHSAGGAEGKGGVETPPLSVSKEGSEKDPPTTVEVNIDIDKTQAMQFTVHCSESRILLTTSSLMLSRIHFGR